MVNRRFNVPIFENEDLMKGNFPNSQVDCLIHTAFCRKNDGKQLVESLQFAEKVFHMAVENGIDVINVSSQAVYGSDEKEELPDESRFMCPEYPYAVAKAASEVLLESVMNSAGGKAVYTNVRMASLVGPGYFIPDNIMYKFILCALNGKTINIVGGKQKFSFLDIRDAAKAMWKLLAGESEKWDKIYNLGPIDQTDIVYMANVVNDCVSSIGLPKVAVQIRKENISLNAGMNSNRFYQQFLWRPDYTLADTIRDCISVIYEKEKKQNRKE